MLRATGRAALFSFLGSFQFAGLAIKALLNKVQSQSHSFLLRFLAQHSNLTTTTNLQNKQRNK